MKIRDIWNKISNFLDRAAETLKKNAIRGLKWAGLDGILNMETAALLTVFLGIFIPTVWAMAATIICMIIKCSYDEKAGHEGEVHDLICASVGAIIGAILLIAL